MKWHLFHLTMKSLNNGVNSTHANIRQRPDPSSLLHSAQRSSSEPHAGGPELKGKTPPTVAPTQPKKNVAGFPLSSPRGPGGASLLLE